MSLLRIQLCEFSRSGQCKQQPTRMPILSCNHWISIKPNEVIINIYSSKTWVINGLINCYISLVVFVSRAK